MSRICSLSSLFKCYKWMYCVCHVWKKCSNRSCYQNNSRSHGWCSNARKHPELIHKVRMFHQYNIRPLYISDVVPNWIKIFNSPRYFPDKHLFNSLQNYFHKTVKKNFGSGAEIRKIKKMAKSYLQEKIIFTGGKQW